VVDDEPDLELLIRQKFRRQIRAGTFSFAFARNGREALEVVSADHDIGVVLTDINMPEMDGLSLLGRLAELNRVLKSVIVSAYGDMRNIRAAMHRGAADFLTKPIDFDDFELTVNKTIQQLKEVQQAVREHDQLVSLRRELDIAQQIQESILPRRLPPFRERDAVEIFAIMEPAREVGGDFYDFFPIGDDRLAFVVADVSGKGVPAALFMAVTRTLLKSTARRKVAPGACLEEVNRLLCADNLVEMFVTVFYAILDPRTGAVAYANAGHNLPYRLRGGAAVEPVPATGDTVLGFLPDRAYQTRELMLAPGEALFLYTDGVTEAMNAAGAPFSDKRLRARLQGVNGGSPETVVRSVVADVKAHAAGAPPSDDLTALAFRYHTAPRSPDA
jgi:sigma-B regulation protein RsbU (phosphoserine phosphatase)